jgi:hypothetical protein
MDFENEIFKPINNFENYLISNLGNVKNKKTNKILKIQKSQKYSTIGLIANNKHFTFLVHRLVAQAFIINPENKLTVNHKNHNTHDNRVDNLEWYSQKEQNDYNYKMSSDKRQTNRARSIICVDKFDNTKKTFRTLHEGSEWLLQNSLAKNIESCLAGIRNSIHNGGICHGYIWKYNDLDNPDLDGEIWKEIPLELTLGKPNYFISNKGRFKNDKGKLVILKNHNSYISVSFRNKEKTITHQLHRVVAKLFVPNVENKMFVNHIDGNKINNQSDNLEWVTKSENTKHAHKNGLIAKVGRKINQYDMNNKFINQYNSIKEASIILKLDKSSIGHVCARDRPGSNSCGGFIFKYVIQDTIVGSSIN